MSEKNKKGELEIREKCVDSYVIEMEEIKHLLYFDLIK